ncbi:hypothetical protein Taro_002455 [Colocasia esculenta]|uniref:CCHC-type domain-containing protein n=1 Tax=Colocasia esculenta TaxID=4460 RepID=A0A843TH79_COLES|nr:hypothetical protein [Colocasia esculenta]
MIVCYECKKPGHMRGECPELKKKLKKEKITFKKAKAMLATWSDEDEDEDTQASSGDEENHCLMARSEDSTEERADVWWASLLRTRFKDGAIEGSRDEFVRLFRAKFVPEYIKDRMEQEFLSLTQGSMTVLEYEARFAELSKYAPHIMTDERRKAKKFVMGLKTSLRTRLVAFDHRTLDEALSATCRQEGKMQQYLEEKKASQKRPATTFQWQDKKKAVYHAPQRLTHSLLRRTGLVGDTPLEETVESDSEHGESSPPWLPRVNVLSPVVIPLPLKQAKAPGLPLSAKPSIAKIGCPSSLFPKCEQINLPELMLSLIRQCFYNPRRSMPHACLITSLLLFIGIQIPDSELVTLKSCDAFDLTAAHQIGYKLVDGRVTRTLKGKEDESSGDEDNADDADQAPMEVQNDTHTEIPDAPAPKDDTPDLRANLNDQFVQLHARLDQLTEHVDTRVDALAYSHVKIQHRLTRLFRDFYELRHPPAPGNDDV